MNDKKVIQIYAINTPNKVYISDNSSDGYGTSLISYLFDGVSPQPTFHKAWVSIPKKPDKITKMERQPNINYRYRLMDETLQSDKFPLEFTREQATYEEGYETYWRDEYKHLQSLYALIYDSQPDIEVEVPFNWIDILTTDEILPPPLISYSVQRTQWSHKGTTTLTNNDVTRQILDLIVFPSIVIHQRPCKFTSEETYKIVRQYIKDNINSKYAVITSDYDFCFTVKKRVPLAKPYQYQVDINNNFFSGKKRRPKMVTRTEKEKQITVFEMTHAGRNYEGYTPIQAFEAESEDALKTLIDNFLAELIAKINEPMTECDKCNGIGYLYAGDNL